MAVRLQFQGIRCFSTSQDALLRPITLLVGENSSGKSTFLAIYRLAYALVNNLNPASFFNEPPFLLGAYDQIASLRSGRAGQVRGFSIGVCRGEDSKESIRADFTSQNGHPFPYLWRLDAGEFGAQFEASDMGKSTFRLESPLGTHEMPLEGGLTVWECGGQFFTILSALTDSFKGDPILAAAGLKSLENAQRLVQKEFSRQPFAFAPIRTEPKRTYDPVAAQPVPEGAHIPMLLAKLTRSSEKSDWNQLRSGLKEFGSGSNLFSDIEVVQKGKKESDPFQVGVKNGGPVFNMVDVGYGVSQTLPILVETLLRSSPHQDFLLQQPEVHLHPRAQAQLGTFFARQADKRRRFLIETHSDYLVDRVRMEVRRGTHLTAGDVSILYFERNDKGATIHNLQLDRHGRIQNPPPGFRRFFLDEERELLEI